MRVAMRPTQRAKPLLVQRKCGCRSAACSCGSRPARRAATSQSLRDRTRRFPHARGEISPAVDDVVRSPGMPLPPRARRDMEARLGHDFSQVRIHTDPAAARSAADIDASAYTVGDHVVFDSGRWAPHSRAGRRLLAHELTHLVQQTRASGAAPRMSTPGDAWEREADRVASAVPPASAPTAREAPAPAAKPAGAVPALMRDIISARSSTAGGGGKPPPELGSTCKVFLGGRRIDHWLAGTIGQFRHLYLDTHKSSADYALIEGGPVGSTTTGTSGAWVKAGNWDARGLHFDLTPPQCPPFVDCLKKNTSVYHAAKHPYHYWNGPNSNSFIWWVLHQCGVNIAPIFASWPYRGVDYWQTQSAAAGAPAVPSPAPATP